MEDVKRKWGRKEAKPLDITTLEAHVPISHMENRRLFVLPDGLRHIGTLQKEHPNEITTTINEKSSCHIAVELGTKIRTKAGTSERAAECFRFYSDVSWMKFFCVGRLTNTDRQLTQAMVERWWPTTHTFHFNTFELGLTPLDFFMITGISVGASSAVKLPVYNETGILIEEIFQSFFPNDYENQIYLQKKRISATGLVKYISNRLRDENYNPEQLARAFMFLVLGTVYFPDSGGGILIGLMNYLTLPLNEIKNFDWGSAILARMYAALDLVTQQHYFARKGVWLGVKELSCCWQFLEVLLYEYLGTLAPILTEEAESFWPLFLKWNIPQFRGNQEGSNRFRISASIQQLEVTYIHKVKWKPYQDHPYMTIPITQHHRRLSMGRKLLRDIQLGCFWYLAERCTRQITGSVCIPTDPPKQMEKLPYAHGDHYEYHGYPHINDLMKTATPLEYATYWDIVSYGSIVPPEMRVSNVNVVAYGSTQPFSEGSSSSNPDPLSFTHKTTLPDGSTRTWTFEEPRFPCSRLQRLEFLNLQLRRELENMALVEYNRQVMSHPYISEDGYVSTPSGFDPYTSMQAFGAPSSPFRPVAETPPEQQGGQSDYSRSQFGGYN